MDTTVSARIPSEIKSQADRKLKQMGSTATELINAAYLYLLETGTLPGCLERETEDKPLVKRLRVEDAAEFRERWDACAVLDNASYLGDNFKELLAEARDERYARFA